MINCHDVKDFQDILIKSNMDQLKCLEDELIKEINKRQARDKAIIYSMDIEWL